MRGLEVLGCEPLSEKVSVGFWAKECKFFTGAISVSGSIHRTRAPAGPKALQQELNEGFSPGRTKSLCFVPQFAMSAATMIACAAEEILMCDHSSLGPVNPQLYIRTALGERMTAAQDMLDQFRMAQQECQDP